ncbi:MAG: hypothetical protein ACRC31_04575 [Cetobacterium sp.]
MTQKIVFDRLDFFIKYKKLIKVAQIMYGNGWSTIVGNYDNDDSILIAFAYNYLKYKMDKENK